MDQLANNIQKYSNTEVTKSNERVSTTETKNYKPKHHQLGKIKTTD